LNLSQKGGNYSTLTWRIDENNPNFGKKMKITPT